MKLVSYLKDNEDRLAIYHDGLVYDTHELDQDLQDNMQDLLWEGLDAFDALKVCKHEKNLPGS